MRSDVQTTEPELSAVNKLSRTHGRGWCILIVLDVVVLYSTNGGLSQQATVVIMQKYVSLKIQNFYCSQIDLDLQRAPAGH